MKITLMVLSPVLSDAPIMHIAHTTQIQVGKEVITNQPKKTICNLETSLSILRGDEIATKSLKGLVCQNCLAVLAKQVRHTLNHTKKYKHKKGQTIPSRRSKNG